MAVLGCIADDFTGASDAASFLVKGGMSVRLYNGIPDIQAQDNETGRQEEEAQAVVIALKSRTQETARAVADSLAAARFLIRNRFILNIAPPLIPPPQAISGQWQTP